MTDIKEAARLLTELIPKYDIHFSIEHNIHKVYYETAAQYLDHIKIDKPYFISEEDKLKAIETDSIWQASWYPTTPIGSHSVYASSLEILLSILNDADSEEQKDGDRY